MNINDFPIEILQHIFRNLSAYDVFVCNRVCQLWNNAVDGLGGDYWKKLCSEEHGDVYEDAYLRANLSWRELYKSLSLWRDVATADVKIRVIAESSGVFRLVKDGVVACAHDFNRDKYPRKYCRQRYSFDTIVYYDVATLEERGREPFELDSVFYSFEVNDNFIITLRSDPVRKKKHLKVKLKSNKKTFTFGKRTGIFQWRIMITENEFYYQNKLDAGQLYRVKLVEQNNDATLETEDIEIPEDLRLLKAVKINSELTKILTADGRIFSLIDKELNLIARTDISEDEFRVLNEYGFKWHCSYIYDLFKSILPLPPYTTAALIYDKLAIIGHTFKIDIYYNPYDSAGKLKFDNVTPVKSIDLDRSLVETMTRSNFINQICVVETLNGHTIVVTCSNRIISVELSHNSRGKRHGITSYDGETKTKRARESH